MDYRLTVTLGRESIDRGELLAEAQALLEFFTHGTLGGAGSEPPRRLMPDILVDPVKAALQLVLTMLDCPNALDATILGLARVTYFQVTDLTRPAHVMTVETEAVPPRVGSNAAPAHADELPHEVEAVMQKDVRGLLARMEEAAADPEPSAERPGPDPA